MREHLLGDPFRCAGDVRQLIFGKCDLQCRTIAASVNPDGQLRDLEQRPQQPFRCRRQVQGQVRERIDQALVLSCRLGCCGSASLFEVGQRTRRTRPLLFQFVVAAPQGLRERVIRITVGGLPQDGVLLLGQLVEGLGQPLSLRLSIAIGLVIDARQLGLENRPAVRAEHAVGEEPGDGVEDGILTEVQRLLVTEVLVRPTSVRVARSAQVVRLAVPRYADHPSPARAEQHPAEQVGPLGLGVDVAVTAGARALLGLPASRELVVHPLRDQWLVGGLERPDPLHRVVDLAVA
nr:hypothetical protein [Amycolatopsis balhimycina]